MKKLIVTMFAVMLGVSAAMGQGYTADWVVKSSNKLLYKVSERGNVIRMELPNEKGGIMPMLVFGKDSLCMLMPETKTYGVFTGEKMRGKTREMLGFELESISNTTEREFRGDEVISGVSCQHYFVKQRDASKVTVGDTSWGGEGGYNYDVWVSEKMRHPVQKYNHVDARMEVMTGVRFTPMPADNFIVPKGWKRAPMDEMLGGLHNMMKGKNEEGLDKLKQLEDLMKNAKSSNKNNNSGDKSKDMNSLLEMFGGAKKK